MASQLTGNFLILTFQKIQIENTMRYHLIPVRMVIVKNKNVHINEGVKQRETVHTVRGNINLYSL